MNNTIDIINAALKYFNERNGCLVEIQRVVDHEDGRATVTAFDFNNYFYTIHVHLPDENSIDWEVDYVED